MRMLTISNVLVAVLMLGLVDLSFGDPLPPPFDTEPFDTDVVGNSAANFEGFFRKDGGPQQFRYFLGTEISVGPGSLTMDFAVPFSDGPGNDFAILTNSQSWGTLADEALFEFFLDGNLQTTLIASLSPDQQFEFDIPGNGIIANRVVVTNITPDPPGVNDLATMTFDNAGVAYPVAAPVTIDIKPGRDNNPINIKTKGGIAVTILTTSSFDSTLVDPLSVKFGPNKAMEAHGRGHFEDVNGDGMLDLVLHFKLQETGIRCGDSYASLTGETFGGQAIAGSDSLWVMGCN